MGQLNDLTKGAKVLVCIDRRRHCIAATNLPVGSGHMDGLDQNGFLLSSHSGAWGGIHPEVGTWTWKKAAQVGSCLFIIWSLVSSGRYKHSHIGFITRLSTSIWELGHAFDLLGFSRSRQSVYDRIRQYGYARSWLIRACSSTMDTASIELIQQAEHALLPSVAHPRPPANTGDGLHPRDHISRNTAPTPPPRTFAFLRGPYYLVLGTGVLDDRNKLLGLRWY